MSEPYSTTTTVEAWVKAFARANVEVVGFDWYDNASGPRYAYWRDATHSGLIVLVEHAYWTYSFSAIRFASPDRLDGIPVGPIVSHAGWYRLDDDLPILARQRNGVPSTSHFSQMIDVTSDRLHPRVGALTGTSAYAAVSTRNELEALLQRLGGPLL